MDSVQPEGQLSPRVPRSASWRRRAQILFLLVAMLAGAAIILARFITFGYENQHLQIRARGGLIEIYTESWNWKNLGSPFQPAGFYLESGTDWHWNWDASFYICGGLPHWRGGHFIPLWPACVVGGVGVLATLPRRRTNGCPSCGYSLEGLKSNTCPECGTTYPFASTVSSRDSKSLLAE